MPVCGGNAPPGGLIEGGEPILGPNVVPLKMTPQNGQRVWLVPVGLEVVPRIARHFPQLTW